MKIVLYAGLAGLALAAASAAAQSPPLSLEFPLRCRLGSECFIQQYFDHDPGPGAKDYSCGPKTYQGHDGTDFRLPSVAARRAGVEVLAAAGGTVQGARDGMEDADVRIAGQASVKGKECGNGVLLIHGDGWQTQYCHMAKGSIRVRSGQTVTAGTVLGLVGESGDAAFPHLHLSVRRGQEKIDPFAFGTATLGTNSGSCNGGASLWSARAQSMLAYRATEVINTGFADGAVTMDDIEAGLPESRRATARGAALTAYVRAIGLRAGDVLSLSLAGPDGSVLAQTAAPALDADKAQWFMLTGRKRNAALWQSGRYTARYMVRRAGQPVMDRRFTVDVQ